MKKNKKLLILFAVLFIAMITASVMFIKPVQQTVVGSSLLSLDEVDLKSSYSKLDGKVWVYTFTQGGLGQYATGDVSSEEASDMYDGEESPEEDFEMRITYDKQQCEYPIKLDSVGNHWFDGQIYDVKLEEYGRVLKCDVSQDKWEEECGSSWTPLLFYSDSGFTTGCNVICGKQRTGAIGRIENPTVSADFTVNVQADGDSYSKSFDTQGQTKGEVGSHAYVIWNGNYNTGKQCQDKDPYIPIYRSGSWYLASSREYEQYVDAMNTLISSTTSDNDAEWKMDAVNSASSKALSKISLGSISNSGSQTAGQWVLDVKDQDIVKPVITAYIEANWIGITTPIGKPDIKSASASNFKSGSNGQVKIVVKNVGDDMGTFNMYGECEDNDAEIYENKEVSVGAGREKTVYLPITGDVSSDTKFTCTVYAQGTQYEDDKSFSFTITSAGTECNPRDKTCMQTGDIHQCTDEGYWNTNPVEECGNGCEYDEYGQPFCTGLPPPPPPPPPRDFSDYIPYILGAVLGLTVFGVWYNKIKPKGKAKPDYVMIGVILLISVGVGFLIYILSKLFIDFVFSWWGLLTGVILLVLFGFMRRLKLI